MKKFIVSLLMLITIATTVLATGEKSGARIGTVINIVYVPASRTVKEVKEWVNHNLVVKKIIESNDDEYVVTVKYDNGETEDLYYDIDGFNIHIGDKVEVDEDFYD